jgi:protein involved in polysaccharide export with SLBB domain
MTGGSGSLCGDPLPEVPQKGTSVTSGAAAPSITDVYVSRIGQNMHIELDGAGFGAAPTTLPVVYNLAQFKFTDTTQGSWTAGGNGSPVYLQYTSWTDSRIVIDGFGSQYGSQYKMSVGDTVSIFVQSTKAGSGSATWTGTLESTPAPPLHAGGPTPQVCTVKFTEIGQNMQIVLDGAGFGTAPTTLPVVYNLAPFKFIDTTQGGWNAGGNGSPVYLQFSYWTDSHIVIDGFGSQYGTTYKVADGDAVSIVIQNSGGPEFTIWTGKLMESVGGKDPTPFNPRVTSVTFDQVGPGLHMQIDGTGFGAAPRTLPVAYNLAQFKFIDTTQGSWNAGGNGSPVYLQFTSWTNSRIVIDGFGSQYGGQYTVATGDDVSITIQNTGGPEFTIWKGTLP